MVTATPQAILQGMQPPTTIAKVITPTLVVSRPHSLFYLAGTGGAAAAPTPGIAGAALTSYTGQLPFLNPAGALEARLANFNATSGQPGTLVLADRLWHNSGLNLTISTAQTINSVALPARDSNGVINGENVFIGLEVSTITGAGTPSFSMTYTNPSGTAGKTANGLLTGVATSAIGAFYPMGTASGDNGVKTVETFTLSATWTSGTAHLVAYRELARLNIPSGSLPTPLDVLTGGFTRAFANTVPFLIWIPAVTQTVIISGGLTFTHLA